MEQNVEWVIGSVVQLGSNERKEFIKDSLRVGYEGHGVLGSVSESWWLMIGHFILAHS